MEKRSFVILVLSLIGMAITGILGIGFDDVFMAFLSGGLMATFVLELELMRWKAIHRKRMAQELADIKRGKSGEAR